MCRTFTAVYPNRMIRSASYLLCLCRLPHARDGFMADRPPAVSVLLSCSRAAESDWHSRRTPPPRAAAAAAAGVDIPAR